MNEWRHEAAVGQKCPNPKLYEMKTGQTVNLQEVIARSSKALTILNFGSCTWPPFMASLQDIRRIHASYSELADFHTIYIEEAHPKDRGDFVNYKWGVDQHK